MCAFTWLARGCVCAGLQNRNMDDVGSDADVGRDSSMGVDTGRDGGAVVRPRLGQNNFLDP